MKKVLCADFLILANQMLAISKKIVSIALSNLSMHIVLH